MPDRLQVKVTVTLVVVQFGKIPLFVRDDGDLKAVISSEARNLSCSQHPNKNQTEPLA